MLQLWGYEKWKEASFFAVLQLTLFIADAVGALGYCSH